MKFKRLPVFLAISIVCAYTTAVAADPQVLDGVAAVVNDKVITFSQVRELTAPLENSLRVSYSGDALADRVKEIRLRAVNDLIERQLILQEFEKMKGQIPPHAIDDRINAMIREEFGGDKSAFLRTVAAQGFTLERVRKMEEEKIIVQAMRSREVKNDPIISPGQVDAYYRKHLTEWTTDTEVKLRMIKIMPTDEREKKKKMAQEIRERLVRGAEFADLARVYSEDSTQNTGGDWGWIKRGDLNPEMEQIVFGLTKGKVSEIIEINQTFYIMLAEDKKVGISKPLKEVRPDIERRLLQIERQKEQQVWIDRLRKKSYVKIY